MTILLNRRDMVAATETATGALALSQTSAAAQPNGANSRLVVGVMGTGGFVAVAGGALFLGLVVAAWRDGALTRRQDHVRSAT